MDSNYGNPLNWTGGVVPGAGNTNSALVGAVVNDVANVGAGGPFTPGALAVEANATVNINSPLTTTTDISGAATVNVNGQHTGNVAVRQDGTLQVNSIVTGNVAAGGTTATVGIANGGNVTGNVTMTRGNLTVNGAIGGGLTTTGAAGSNVVTVGGTGTVAGATTFTGATANVSGALNNGLTVGTGSDVTIAAGGTVAGAPTTVNGGALTNNGTISGGGLTLNGSQSDGFVTNNGIIIGNVVANNGVFTTTNVVSGNLTQNGGGVVNAQGTVGGIVTINGGDFNVTGALVGVNAVTNNGRFNVTGGPVTVATTVTNKGVISVVNGQAFNFGTMNNSAGLGLGAGVPGATTATFGGAIVGTAGSAFNMQNAAAGDSMTVQGGVSGTNTVAVDLDLTTTNAGFADVLTVNGPLNGNVTVDVDSIRGPLGYTLQTNPITVINATSFGGGLTTTLTGDLPQGPTGLIIYRILEDAANADVQIQSDLNPAIGGVAAAMSSVQSLVGSVVNRPSGAYVSGIAFDSPDNCSTGVWGRTLGGRIDADSSARNSIGTTVNSNGTLKYGGFQGGADFGCFEAFDGGWDISGGLLVGASFGKFTERASGLITAGDFDQYFLGGYVAASRGNWSGEAQLRYAMTDFTFDNPGLGVRNADTSSDSITLSGSLTYRHELQPGLALLPSAGFSVTDNDSASLALTNPGGVQVGTLTVESHTNVTTFLGATLSKTTVNEATASAINAFLTGTYYFDGSGSRDSTFTTAGGLGRTTLTTSETGNFGEISAGGSIVRLLGNSGSGGVRQVNYSVRVDARYGDDLDGVGVTGQVRYQF